MSDQEVSAGAAEGPQMRRRVHAPADPTKAPAANQEPARSSAPDVDGARADRAQPPHGSSRPVARWSVMDVTALLLVGAAVLTLVALAPQFAATYNAYSAAAAQRDIPVSMWTFLQEQFYLLPLPGRDGAATEATRAQQARQSFASQQEARQRGVRRAINAEFERLASDPSFTRYANTRIFFRPLPRKVFLEAHDVAAAASMSPPPPNPIQRDGDGDAFVMTWGMAEIDPLTNTLNATLAAQLECGLDGRTRMKVMRTQRSMETGVRVYSSYAHANGEAAEDALELVARGPCLARVMELMCAGDKWEIFCPPEASPANTTQDAYEHRVDVRSVPVNAAPVARVEAELDYVARQLPVLEAAPRTLDEAARQEMMAALKAAAPVTRATLLQKALGR